MAINTCTGAALSCRRASHRAALALLILSAALGCSSAPPVSQPQPTTGPRCLVFEQEGRIARVLSQILEDQSVSVRMKQLGARWLWVTPETIDDTGGFPEYLQEHLDTAMLHGLPYLFLTDELGNVAWHGKPPDNPAAFLELLEGQEKTRKTESAVGPPGAAADPPLNPTKKRPEIPTAE